MADTLDHAGAKGMLPLGEPLKLSLFGGVEVDDLKGRPLPQKAKAMLCILARSAGRPVSRERLAGLLWSDRPKSQAQASVRQTLRQLRVALGNDRICSSADGLVLDPTKVLVDVARLETACEGGTDEEVRNAADLYVGDFAADVLVDGEPAQEWLNAERVKIRDLAAHISLQAIDHCLAEGKAEAARKLAVRFLTFDPYFEPMHRAVMRALVALGRRAAAVEQYRVLRHALAADLNSAPDPETEELLADVLTSAAHAKPASAQDDVPVHAAADQADPPTIAVLPIEALGTGGYHEHLARGFAEELIVSLSGWRSFPVVSPASSLIALDHALDHQTLGQRLNARYLVVARLYHDDGRARLTARLVASDDGHQLWGGGFEVDLADPLSAQEELAASIAAVVHQQTVASEVRRIVWKRTSALLAWERYILGQSDLQTFSPAGNACARDHFQAALDIDSDYAAAHVGLSTSYCWDLQHAAKHEWPQLLLLAEGAATRALEIDWNSPLAHTRLGAVYTWREDFDRGLAETELALHLNPSDAVARLALGNRLDLVGNPTDGIGHMEKGLRLNPLDPRSALYHGYLARAYLSVGEPETALKHARRGLACRPKEAEMHLRLAACLANLDEVGAARSALQTCESIERGYIDRKRDWSPYRDRFRNEVVLHGLKRHALI